MRRVLVTAEVHERVRRLPALPEVVHALDKAARRPDTSLDAVLALITRDAALTAAALRLANSPFYGVSGRIVSVRDAVRILGLQALSAAVTTAAVGACFGSAVPGGFDHLRHWRHSLATALCAQKLAATRGVDPSTAYTAGLLHDLGTLAMAAFYPTELAEAMHAAAVHDQPRHLAERERLGLDHAELGGMIARHWRLSPAVVAALSAHHDVPAGSNDTLLDVLHLSDNIVHALDIVQAEDESVPPLSLGVWERMAPTATELRALFLQIETQVGEGDLCLH